MCIFSDDFEMPEIVPDLLHRVDRALELASKFKEVVTVPAKETGPKPSVKSSSSSSSRKPSSSSTTTKAPSSTAPKAASAAARAPRLPVLPRSRGLRVKPAHVTAPFQTNPRLPASNYRRQRSAGPIPKRAVPRCPAATSRQWLSSNNTAFDNEGMSRAKISARMPERGAKFVPEEARRVTGEEEAGAPPPAGMKCESHEPRAATRCELHEPRGSGDELRRSLSAESLNSPRIQGSRTPIDARRDMKAQL